ncbi:DUF6528 family protein [Niabella insulamsoli]|uniref:DUF6528 family protein n=1 Tax=Niabella insulamsoli TaxID=3144874 RepID=UPI0031FD4EBA
MYLKPYALFVICLFLVSDVFAQQSWVACGGDKVMMLDSEKSTVEKPVVTWSWDVKEALGIPAAYQKLLVPLDECKPVGQHRLLITSSGGGVVLLEKSTKKVLFYANAPMAHSAALLPRNRVVVALSTHKKGNSIELYDLNHAEKVLFKDSLYSGHGVVWNAKQERLYALGFDELRAYELRHWETQKPVLQLVKSWKLPDEGGHDLSMIDDNELLVSTHHNVFVFDSNKGGFRVFDLLAGRENIKSANYDKQRGSLVYTQAEESWWTHHIYQKNPDKTVTIPDLKLYKVRVIDNKSR